MSSETLSEQNTLLEQLGYPRDAKLLILHADDLGVATSVNKAAEIGFAARGINSGSVLVQGYAFPEVAHYARSHPQVDLGLHITLSSDLNQFYRPVLPPDRIKTLVNDEGNFPRFWNQTDYVDPQEAEAEISAQIELANTFEFHPTHLDSHQFRLYRNGPALFDSFVKVGRKYKIPILLARNWFSRWAYLGQNVNTPSIVLDQAVWLPSKLPPNQWASFYTKFLQQLKQGVTQLIVHPAIDDQEMQRLTANNQYWGPERWQHDLDYFSDPNLRRLLRDNQIELITWRELAKGTGDPETIN